MICFFDPAHGAGTVNMMWMPQWGVPRAIEVCQFCAQRIQTTQPPFYQPMQQGYPQAGYPQQQAYAQPGYPQHQQGQGHSTGAMIGAGAAGLAGGMLLGEMMSDDDDDRGGDDRGGDGGDGGGDGGGGDDGFF